jgi:hypothetical protein
VLVIGMGDPAPWRIASRIATRVARRSISPSSAAGSMAFAPSVLDAGHTDNAALDMQDVMLDGMLGALRAEHMLAEAGLAAAPALRRCTFDVGAPRVQAAGVAFAAAFERRCGQP